ncbi:MAG TPA: hypothetical protein VFQ57_08360 [Sphingomonas sp.]|jgi:hypothetical protein|nr:hypothetical protein [Sphingomonas sp.]
MMDRPKIKRDAERARRIIAGLNDEQSLRTLRRYLAELEAQLQARFGVDEHGRPV